MHAFLKYANVSFWPKADIETESKSPLANVCFGEKSGHSGTESKGLSDRLLSTQAETFTGDR